jgi:hypothetical protein
MHHQDNATVPDLSSHSASGETTGLDLWICAWYRSSVAQHFVQPPYHPNEITLSLLAEYFTAGLTPTEAVAAIFNGADSKAKSNEVGEIDSARLKRSGSR